MARIKVIQHEEASGRLKDIYDELVRTRGKLRELKLCEYAKTLTLDH